MILRTQFLVIIVLAISVFAVFPEASYASGSYGRRPPRPRAHRVASDYSLGRDIFKGKMELAEVGYEEFQTELLEDLQGRLPWRVRRSVNLVKFAGNLTEKQLRALRHYLLIRYRVKE